MTRLLGWLSQHAVAIVLCGLALVLLYRFDRMHRDLAAQLARAQEAAELERRGLEVAVEASRRELAQGLDELRRRMPELQAALDAARKAGVSTPAATIEASTGAVAAHGTPRPPQPSAGAPVAGGPSATTPAAAGAACLLAEGDQGRIDVGEVVLEAQHGSRVLVGAAQAWRTSPLPETKILAGAFSAPLTSMREEPPRVVTQRARWALHGGPVWERWQATPTGGEAGGELRVLGPAWISAGVRVAEQSSGQVHLRWEW